MLPFFGMSAIVIALAAPSTPAQADVVNAAPVPVPVAAVAQSEHRRSDQQAVTVKRTPAAEDPYQQQLYMHLIFPALSGDGGG
jgi:hypothetical protein